MQTLIMTLREYIHGLSDLESNMIAPLIEGERTQFTSTQWNHLIDSFTHLQTENELGEQVYHLLVKYSNPNTKDTQ